ncbi:helix-turn-helix transcriptional regulator [Ktedonobacter sp. SOSP1-85]|uniref:LuxR C-terminal-related transcriptional regulator n=1 Tax=Ktedonobacter sp. SOSP1-85 TaxID=2778367 RepID=UPI001915226C|nr:LuxR C-terminal-related transcriptional regulator [Ktedonobacter sp. SOSP1-85]GHO72688.1 helix-turn-helix transcriptional regulator [Ktedonobacter sp. SOSP1-85]
MPKAAPYHLTWHVEHENYEVYDQRERPILTITPGEPGWFTWLDTIASFAFRGRQGQLTVRKESRQWGHGYWYAYNRVGPKLMKRYLGRTADLTLIHLEEMAAQLSGDVTFPPDDVSGETLSDEREQNPWASDVSVDGSTMQAVETEANRLLPSELPTQPALLFSTRLQVPRPRVRLVSRTRLVEQLQQGRERGLTLISAPAGFGKTTLLAQWLADHKHLPPMSVAWLSLEAQDNDSTCFLSSLIAALQTVNRRLGANALALLQTGEPLSPETVMTLLVNDLTHYAREDITLVLDDYHVIEAPSIHCALATLVEHLPTRLHLILATRADPPLPLSRLRAHGHILEVRAAALRFSLEESSSFLQSTMDLSLSEESITTLQNRTEGWIAGLQLAALALAGHPDPSAFLSAFNGSHRFVLDYLSEEVLLRQPASIQSFLLHTAILERLSAPLCDAVTGEPASQAILETLERANLFVVSLDEKREWYRYHHLFAEALTNRLKLTMPNMVPELHRRASIWYEEHAFVIEAVHHALAAHDDERMARLLERDAIAIELNGQYQTVLNWMRRLPEEMIRTRPMLSLIRAIGLIFARQFEQAEACLRDAEVSRSFDHPDEHVQMILGGIAYCRTELSSLSSNDLAGSVTMARRALSLLPQTRGAAPLRAGALMYVARAYQLSGDVTSPNEQSVLTAMALVPTIGPLGRLRITHQLARLRGLQGRLSEALAIYEQLLPVAEEFRASGASAFYYLNWSHLLREHNQLEAAERILAKGMEAMRMGIFLEPITALLGYATQARLQQARGEFSQARATIEELVQLTEHDCFPSPLRALATAVRAQLLLAQSDLERAVAWANASGLSTEDEVSYPREMEYLILARIRIEEGRNDPTGPLLGNVLRLLSRLLEDAEAKARMGSVLEILILKALALHARRDQSGALTTLGRALAQAAGEGYIRLFIDEGTPLLTLLRQAQERGIAPDYVATLLSSFGATALDLQPPYLGELAEPLTRREREVLQLLASGASNGEIARRLVVSLGTVKKYVSNITGKLGVQNRTQAVIRAQTLHLL